MCRQTKPCISPANYKTKPSKKEVGGTKGNTQDVSDRQKVSFEY